MRSQKRKKRRRNERSNLREEIKEAEDRGELMKSKVGDDALEDNTESVEGRRIFMSECKMTRKTTTYWLVFLLNNERSTFLSNRFQFLSCDQHHQSE